MLENTKCDCGHQNPLDTQICESCGKDLNRGYPIEMRYEGRIRKSRKKRYGIWRFFSSVKTAITIIFTLLSTAILGSILPQENTLLNTDPSHYYKNTYGTFGEIYYSLGFSHTYESWWFLLLCAALVTSLFICSLDRVIPLYRALQRKPSLKSIEFIRMQKVAHQVPNYEGSLQALHTHLSKSNYRVDVFSEGLTAEKHRLSRWGPYILHIGLILFLFACILRLLPGWYMDEYLAFPENKKVAIPGTNYTLENKKFDIEYYTKSELPTSFKGEAVKKYATHATLYDSKGNQVKEHVIGVNEPFVYDDLLVYQFDYDLKPRLYAVKPALIDKKTGEILGEFNLSVTHPPQAYKLGRYTLELKEKFMEFGTDEKGQPVELSNDPVAPAFIFLIKGPNLSEQGEPFIYFPRPIDKMKFRQDQINRVVGEKLDLQVQSMKDIEWSNSVSYLNIRVDKGMPLIWISCIISMIGLVVGMYFQHRRIWVRVHEDTLFIGGHANKNWIGFKREVEKTVDQLTCSL